MHGTHTSFGAWLDNVSMISYILILWMYNLKILKNLSNRTFFICYSVLLSYYAYSYWFLDSGLGIGVDLFELSIGLWISTEILVKLPNLFGRTVATVTVLECLCKLLRHGPLNHTKTCLDQQMHCALCFFHLEILDTIH